MDQFTNAAAAEALLHGNIQRVFNERDADKRIKALGELWTATAVMYEPGEALSGQQAISDNVGTLHQRLPADTVFTPIGPVLGHHDLYVLPWQAGAPGQPPHTLGRDIAILKNGAIDRLYVLLDQHL